MNNFQIEKFQPDGVVYHLLKFLPILAWRCLEKCCLLKKACTSLGDIRAESETYLGTSKLNLQK